MNNIIWNSNELKKIQQILKKANLRVNRNNEIKNIVEKPEEHQAAVQYYIGLPAYNPFQEEFINLFYIQDREKISEILTKASQIIPDKNNKLHYGLIFNLSKIDPKNHVEIFNVYKELIASYEHIICKVVDKMFTPTQSENLIREKIEYFKNSTETTIEERLIKNHMNKIFTFTNGICDNELITPLIEKLNNSIKSRIIFRYNQILAKVTKQKIKDLNDDYEANKNDSYTRFLKKRMKEMRPRGSRLY